MGWFPNRDKNNRVPPELMNWPHPPSEVGNFIWAIQRAVGKNKHGGPRKVTIYKLLAEQAILMGWLNGKRLERRRK